MLKFLYKTLLVSVLSGSLLMLNFSFNSFSFVKINQASAQASTNSQTLTTDGIKDSDLMATLTMIGVGLLTQRLWACTMTTDMMIAAAGGAAFVAGEILSTFNMKGVMSDIQTNYQND